MYDSNSMTVVSTSISPKQLLAVTNATVPTFSLKDDLNTTTQTRAEVIILTQMIHVENMEGKWKHCFLALVLYDSMKRKISDCSVKLI